MTVYNAQPTLEYNATVPRFAPPAFRSEYSQREMREARSALGNITESAAALPSDVRRCTTRRTNYSLTRLSGRLLPVGNRISSCMQVPAHGVQRGTSKPGISKNANGVAHWHGVGHCGSVWSCMVCAQKIAEKRRLEIKTAMAAHRKNGSCSILVTATFPHNRNDKLSDILPLFAKALSKFKGSRAFRSIKQDLGCIGQVRAMEVTHGVNGWHPHVHEIWFVDGTDRAALDTLQGRLHLLWAKSCISVGLQVPSLSHGLRVDLPISDGPDDALSSYLTKFAYELTYGHEKTSRKAQQRTPRQILASIQERFTASDCELWREYSAAFKGRAQVYWSRGLKDRFEIGHLSDSEALEQPESEVVRDFTVEEFALVCKTKTRVTTLEIAERSPDQLDAWLKELSRFHVASQQLKNYSKNDLRLWISDNTTVAMRRLGLL